jgi:hypothetical protein
MLGLSVICWATWKSRNMACFEKKLLKNPCEIIFSAYAFFVLLGRIILGGRPETDQLRSGCDDVNGFKVAGETRSFTEVAGSDGGRA